MPAVFTDAARAALAAAALRAIGIPDRDITILRGDEGADRLDGSGAVLMLRVRGDRKKRSALIALRGAGGHFHQLLRFATEELEPWRGTEPDIPSDMRS